jgi:hypothetical protein
MLSLGIIKLILGFFKGAVNRHKRGHSGTVLRSKMPVLLRIKPFLSSPKSSVIPNVNHVPEPLLAQPTSYVDQQQDGGRGYLT